MGSAIDTDTRRDAAAAPPPAYWDRRHEIERLAAGLDRPARHIDYRDIEHQVWAEVNEGLGPLWDAHAASGVLAGRDRLDLAVDRVPQLVEVDRRLRALTGFGYRAVEGILPAEEFFRALESRIFPSTQYVRWEGSPLYTPEPDVIHEVFGHGNALACPPIAELHRLAGRAYAAARTDETRRAIADVFWFTVEFGVVVEAGAPKAYGTGLLSSPGELQWFVDHAEFRPLDADTMRTTAYDISRYQPVLFAGESLEHVVDVVTDFYSNLGVTTREPR